ncbi:MAG: aspartyl/asparaginyl beta-hydroxylase domain-containing protein [Betaproteobacteria bacterium]|nr:aspartyl/asparaginyl beta-hydroxylase domain-containing protein [Betaproteobacteria bacterium]
MRIAGDAPGAPVDIRTELQRIRTLCDGLSAHLAREIAIGLADAGIDAGAAGERFGESVDLLLGKKNVYYSAPLFYHYPGLQQRQFFPRAEFAFLDDLERCTPAIKAEVLDLIGGAGHFEPYVQSAANRPPSAQGGMADNPAWAAFYLWKDGRPVAENLARCPQTAAVIAALPLCQMPGRSPTVLFSRLLAGAHIPPHHGFINTRLIGHLPLIVPRGCAFRVGNDIREWQEGRAWLFDDTVEHEAWNRGPETRVVLIFEVWRPELSEIERRAIVALFEAIDRQSSAPAAWGI